MASGKIERKVCFVDPISTIDELINLVQSRTQMIFGFGIVKNSQLSNMFNHGDDEYVGNLNMESFCFARYASTTIIDCLLLCEWHDIVLRFNPTTRQVTDRRPYMDSTDTFVSKAYSYTVEAEDFDEGNMFALWEWILDGSSSFSSSCFIDEEYYGSITRIATGSQNVAISSAEKPSFTDNGAGYSVGGQMIKGNHYDGSTTYSTSGITSRVNVCFLRKNYFTLYGHK